MHQIFNPANGLTAINFCCGVLAIIFATTKNFNAAIALILIGAIADLFDGKIARKLGIEGNFGAIFDDIADGVSFGLAPAVVVATIADFSIAGITTATIYFAAVVVRLVHFTMHKGKTPEGFFAGVPSPAGAAIVGCVAFMEWPVEIVLGASFISAILMIMFHRNWPHFAKIAAERKILEICGMIVAALTAAIVFDSYRAVPIGVVCFYLLTVFWRHPLPKEEI